MVARLFVTGGIMILTITVLVSLAIHFYYSPKMIAKRELQSIARDYYENYFYNNMINSIRGKTPAEIFEKYEKNGFAKVKLRQLLLFDNGRHEKSMKYFDDYKCDQDETEVLYKPKEPFGAKDYTLEISPVCEGEL